MDVFVLKIALGNDAMQTLKDVAFALEATAAKLKDHDGSYGYGHVLDSNGNTVGMWEVQ